MGGSLNVHRYLPTLSANLVPIQLEDDLDAACDYLLQLAEGYTLNFPNDETMKRRAKRIRNDVSFAKRSYFKDQAHDAYSETGVRVSWQRVREIGVVLAVREEQERRAFVAAYRAAWQ